MDSLQDRIYQMAEKAGIPLAVHFDLTYRCNLHCIHCYLPEKDLHPPPSYIEELKRQNKAELTTQEIFDILDQLAECGTLFLTFSGGEIFVRRDLLNIVEYARKKRFSVSLMTTGSIRFDENVAERLADIGIQFVDVSLYSAEPEVHDSVTSVPGSFNKTIKAIELLREKGIKVNVKCPLMKTNIKTFKGLVALAGLYGVDWMFDPNLTAGKDGNKKPTYLSISDNEMKAFYTFIMEMSKSEKKKEGEEISAPICEDLLNENPCGASHSSCYISPYGDVQPCIEISIICGNLREKPFKEIWESSEGMLMVRAIKRKDLRNCPDCPNPDYCHRCIGHAYLEHGDLLAPSEVFCRNVKISHQIQEEKRQNG